MPRERVTERNLPDQFDGSYAWGGGHNTLCNRFIEVSPTRTKWVSTCSFHFDGAFMKLMGLLAGGMFRRQSMSFLLAFKAFAENGQDIRDSV